MTRDCDTCPIVSTCNRKTINRCDGYCWLDKYDKDEQDEIIKMRLEWIKEDMTDDRG